MRTDSRPAATSAALGGVEQPEFEADRSRRHDERQRGRLQNARHERAAPAQHAPVQQRGHAADEQQRDQEHRHHRQVRCLSDERVEIEPHAARHEEDRDEEPEAHRLELPAKVRVRHDLVAIEQRDDRARDEGSRG